MTQILKEYTIKDIEKYLPNYRLIKIEDVNGREIVNYNNPSTDIKKHFQQALKRFNSDLIPDDYYYFCLSLTARKAKDPDKFLVKKGNPQQDQPTKNIQPVQTKNDLISINAALDYITQIANLKNDVTRLELENKQLKEECAELSAELEELEAEKGEGLSENKNNSTVDYLKETAPTVLASLDRYFELQERKIQLEEKKIEKGIFTPSQQSQTKPGTQKQTVKRKPIQKLTFEIGSPEHLNYVRLLYNSNREEELNKELDKLEQQTPAEYEIICNELNLFEDETTDENQN